MNENTPTNPYGWPLPFTDDMLYSESPYAPLPAPEQNVAERLVFIAHRGFNKDVWGLDKGRLDRYWAAFRERIEGCAYTADVASWWDAFMRDMPLRDRLPRHELTHEKNLLVHPMALPGVQVPDGDVLNVFRTYSYDLRDRCQMWVRERRALNVALLDVDEED